MSLLISGDLTLRKTWQPMDPDAAAYIAAVEAADTQALEEKTKIAIDNFVLGCKADGIWSAIKASCILAGARSLAGALVPLVGAAPTNVGPFVSGDYNRKTGLVGDGSTKYLDSNRNNNADPQNSKHGAVYISTVATSTASGLTVFPQYLGAGSDFTGAFNLARVFSNSTRLAFRCHHSVYRESGLGPGASSGLIGLSRSLSASYTLRAASANTTISQGSETPYNGNIGVFRGLGGADENSSWVNGRLAFYSIGESLDLALLDARVTTLINAFAAAIP